MPPPQVLSRPGVERVFFPGGQQDLRAQGCQGPNSLGLMLLCKLFDSFRCYPRQVVPARGPDKKKMAYESRQVLPDVQKAPVHY